MNELMTDQSNAIEHLKRWRVGALFMEPGTGKTRVAVELVKHIKPSSVLWVGPLRTLGSVRADIDKWGGIDNLTMVGVESISASDRIYLEARSIACNGAMCVVDESLKIKNSGAKRTKRLIEIGQLCGYRIILNGTPISKNLVDMWSQMEFLSPLILNMSETKFKNTFCKYTTITKRMPGGYKEYKKEFITGYENIDYLYSLIRHYVYECDLKLNISQIYSTIYYRVDDECREEYSRIKSEFLSDEMLQWKNNNIFLEMTSKMQHSYCDCQNKIDAVRKVVADESKTIIFCRFVRSQEACKKAFPDALVLSYQKESFGLNLQDYDTTIYFDKVWDYALRLQSSRRTFRTGQERDCHYFDVTGDVGLESLIDRNIDKKICMSEYLKKVSIEDINKDL